MASKLPPDDAADAGYLFSDDPPPRRPSAKKPSSQAPSDGYDLDGDLPDDDEPVPVPRAPIPAATPNATKARKKREEPAEEARVEEIWSRGAEWGSTLILLGIVGAGVLVGFYVMFSVSIGLAFLTLLIGGAAWVLLSYPIVITLERPVRMTPEQALKDYYAALSHHFPHYKRMWLLLSDAGRTHYDFQSFPAFRTYWKNRLKQLRGGKVGGFTPLMFEVADFKSDKSHGKTSVEALYTIAVRPRGVDSGPPLDSVKIDSGMVKGPDNMWYLNNGTLPGRL